MADLQGLQQASGASGDSGGSGAQSVASAKSSNQALSKINRDLEEKSAVERAKELKLPYVKIAEFPINPDILPVVPFEEAQKSSAIPFFRTGQSLKIAVVDPNNAETKTLLKNLEAKGFSLQTHIASRGGMSDAFKLYSSDQYKIKTEVKNVVNEEELIYEKELENLAALKDKMATLPAEEALNTLHVSAIKSGASDIHYQPEEDRCTVRFRIDGVLHNVFEIARDAYANLANQLKYKAKMQLNVTNVPQDGRFRFIVNERKIDVRVSSLPTEYGESFVCRILDSGKHFATFEELGFSGRSLEILKKASELAQGMVLVTGPTGSGKTTTLYVLLTNFNKPDVKIITLEDPIEYHLAGLTQSQINEKRGYTFANGLRSILRQDPDVVMIGEIRDLETAEVCSQAALTGHVVLSTLHTNSAVETIPRLITIGLPAFMVAPSISVVVAQRLVRKLCGKCAVDEQISEEQKKVLEEHLQKMKTTDSSLIVSVPETLKTHKGCEECNFTGFRGQLVVSEVLSVDDNMRNAILAGKSAPDILAIARAKGMFLMIEDAILKVIQGMTTMDEVHRAINA